MIMIITDHCYEQAKKRFGISVEEIKNDIRRAMGWWCKKGSKWYFMSGEYANYVGDIWPEWFIIKSALYKVKDERHPSVRKSPIWLARKRKQLKKNNLIYNIANDNRDWKNI